METSEGKRAIGRPGRKFEDNIKVDHKEMDWTNLAEGGEKWVVVVNVVMDIGALHIPGDLPTASETKISSFRNKNTVLIPIL